MIMTRKLSLTKTATWRVLATSDTFLLGLFVIYHLGPDASGVEIAGSIAGLEVATKLFLYYFHERVWAKIMQRKEK